MTKTITKAKSLISSPPRIPPLCGSRRYLGVSITLQPPTTSPIYSINTLSVLIVPTMPIDHNRTDSIKRDIKHDHTVFFFFSFSLSLEPPPAHPNQKTKVKRNQNLKGQIIKSMTRGVAAVRTEKEEKAATIDRVLEASVKAIKAEEEKTKKAV